MIQFWDPQQGYVDEWLYTNQLPPKVVISLTTGKKTTGSQTPEDFAVREVTVASLGVPVALQGGRGVGAAGLQQNQNPNMQDPNMRNPNMQPPMDGRGSRDGRDGRDARQPGGFQQNPGRGPGGFPQNPGRGPGGFPQNPRQNQFPR
jgi:hypothetical protein